MYQIAKKCFWHEGELSMGSDLAHFKNSLNERERRFVKYILSFFAIADSLVNSNLLERFMGEIPYKEAKAFLAFQMMMEDIHNTAYSMMLDHLVDEEVERKRLFDAARTIPAIGAMTNYIRRCTESTESMQIRLLRMACAEGILFSGAFCAIYWFRSRGLMPGLGHANSMIARDEGLHTQFSLLLYCKLEPVTTAEVHAVFSEAVDIAVAFTCDAMPEGMLDMNAGLMTTYIKYVADGLLEMIGVPKLYNARNPFGFMEQLKMERLVNFFECRVGEYQHADVGESTDYNDDF